jgi:hypothetical protein
MATVSAEPASRIKLHERGAWSAREDRVASAVWLSILWAGMLAGFGVDIPRYLKESPPPPMVLHVHAAVFTVWMLILTAQVLLVLRNRVAWHRSFGWFAVGWACLMAVMGPWAAMTSQATFVNSPDAEPQFIAANILNMLGFLSILAWGISQRKNPAAHRRLMILSSISLADPGFARFSEWVWPNEPHSIVLWFFYTFYGNVLLIGLMTAWDWWRGRLMRPFAIGAMASLGAEIVATGLYFWPPWKTVAHGLVLAWVKHFR